MRVDLHTQTRYADSGRGYGALLQVRGPVPMRCPRRVGNRYRGNGCSVVGRPLARASGEGRWRVLGRVRVSRQVDRTHAPALPVYSPFSVWKPLLILIFLMAGCASTPPTTDVCYTAAEDARVKRWFKEAQEYEEDLTDDLREERRRRTYITGLKGYCS